jgi:hypothetical protein
MVTCPPGFPCSNVFWPCQDKPFVELDSQSPSIASRWDIRIETGYPNTELNMVYFFPALAGADGKPIGATEAPQPLDGKTYQRWSRHRTGANPWKIGRDHIGTHVILIEDWLDREFEK